MEKCELVCVRYTRISGTRFGQDQVYKLVTLKGLEYDGVCTITPVRTRKTKYLGECLYRIDASQSSWLKTPTSRVTITVCMSSSSTSSFHEMFSFVVTHGYINDTDYLTMIKEVYTTKPMVIRFPMSNTWKTIVREIDTLSPGWSPTPTRLSSLTYTEENGFRTSLLKHYAGDDAEPGAQLVTVDTIGRACVLVSCKAIYVQRFDDHQSDG